MPPKASGRRRPPPSVLEVQAYFFAHRRLFETVELAAIGFETREEAEELCARLRSGQAELPVDLPAEPEIVDPPAGSGYLGLLSRADLPPEVAEAVFDAGAGELVGPVRHAGQYRVYRVLLPPRPELTEAVFEWCEARVAAGELASGSGAATSAGT